MEAKYRKVNTKSGVLTAILIKDDISNGYTAFFKEKPSIISEGDTIKETIDSLKNILEMVAE